MDYLCCHISSSQSLSIAPHTLTLILQVTAGTALLHPPPKPIAHLFAMAEKMPWSAVIA